MIDDFTQIVYIVIIGDEYKGISTYCGFNVDYFDRLPIFWEIIKFPTNIFEIGKNNQNQLKTRIKLRKAHKIIPLLYETYLQFQPKMPFHCIIYDSKVNTGIPKLHKKWKYSPLFIKYNQISKITYKSFFKHFKPLIESFIDNEACKKINFSYTVTLDSKFDFDLKIFNFTVYGGVPCFDFKRPNEEIKNDIFSINNSIQKILLCDGKKTNGIDLILTSAPFFSKKELEKVISNTPDEKKLLVKKICYQKSFKFDFEDTDDVFLGTRKNEFQLYQFCMGLVFEHYMCPIYQVEPGIQTEIRDAFLALQKVIKSKRFEEANYFYNKIEKYYDYRMLQNLPKNKLARIKIYSDAPIEFFVEPESQLPLLVSSNITKIPMTPGTDFFNQIGLLSDLIFENFNLFENILIIRSYKDSDTIKDDFISALKNIKKDSEINITIKDVSKACEVIETLNKAYTFSIVIFDCHGGIIEGSHGVLSLSAEDFDIWDARDFITYMPPIILFSSCLTNVYNNSAFSVANGFLAAGARATLATTTSVDSKASADYMIRIILRINDYLETLRNISGSKFRLYWSDMVCTVLRTCFVSDVLNFYKIDDNHKNMIYVTLKPKIYSDYKNWYNDLLYYLSNFLKKTETELRNEIKNQCLYFESLKYINLGNADKIIICSNEDVV